MKPTIIKKTLLPHQTEEQSKTKIPQEVIGAALEKEINCLHILSYIPLIKNTHLIECTSLDYMNII